MRVTSSYLLDGLKNNVGTSLDNLNAIQRQVSSGKRLTQPSDDPSGTSLALSLRNSLTDNTQYARNQQQAKDFLSVSDSALNDASNIINQARQIASQAANSTQSTDSLAALNKQVDGLATALSNVANTNFHGKYVFGGTATTTAPFDPTDATHTYKGNSGAVQSILGPNDVQTINTPGDQVFSGLFSTLNNLKSALSAGNISGISSQITALDTNLSTVSGVRSSVGAQMNEVDSITQRMGRANLEFQDTISQVEDVDLASAYVQLQSAQNVYQASLSTTAQAFKYSLTNYL